MQTYNRRTIQVGTVAQALILATIGFSAPHADAQASPQNYPDTACTAINSSPGVPTRAAVRGDYLLIDYDAATHQTLWLDYRKSRKGNCPTNPIARNGSFMPVVFTREKVAVHVRHLHFNDLLTVTTSPMAIPEGGADIRGVTPTTQLTSLLPTLDAVQNAAATGGVTPQPGLGFSTTGSLGTITVTGITPGTVKMADKLAYTNATLTVSGAQIAELFVALVRNMQDLRKTIRLTRFHQDAASYLPGSIDGIRRSQDVIQQNLQRDAGEIENEVNASRKQQANKNFVQNLTDAARTQTQDFAAFDDETTAVQQMSSQMNTLAGALSSQGFGTRAMALQANYSVLKGILDFANQGVAQANCVAGKQAASAITGSQLAAMKDKIALLTEEQLRSLTPDQVQGITGDQLATLSEKQRTALLSPRTLDPMPGQDQPACSAFDRKNFDLFLASYRTELSQLHYLDGSRIDSDDFERQAEKNREAMWDEMIELKKDLKQIDAAAGEIFEKMNTWYSLSDVEQTDVLSPFTGNAIVRLSIVVQRGYTPFTFTANPIAVTSTTAQATTQSSSATTSTPAHTVKTILIEVHRLANFNASAGVMMVHVPSDSYAVVAGTPPMPSSGSSTQNFDLSCNGVKTTVQGNPVTANGSTTYSAPTYSCITKTGTTTWQVTGVAGITWFPFGRDYFPLRAGWARYRRNYIPGVFVGTSVTSLGNAFGAVSVEPMSGISFLVGIGSAHRSTLPIGTSLTTPVASGYALPSPQPYETHAGLAAGITVDLNVFAQIFKSIPSGTTK